MAGAVLLCVLAGAATVADAAVSVTRAEVSGSRLRVEGRALANRAITVDGVAMGTSDDAGSFRIERDPFTPPADCTVDVDDGSGTPAVAALSGCTVSSPSPPPQPAGITITTASLLNGNVGTDYTGFIEACCYQGAPVRWSLVAGTRP